MANKERVKLLVDALRSGDFRQARNRLRDDDDKMCCLGVACEVARISDAVGYWSNCTFVSNAVSSDHSTSNLPSGVAEWYGFSDIDPDLGRVDTHGYSRTVSATTYERRGSGRFQNHCRCIRTYVLDTCRVAWYARSMLKTYTYSCTQCGESYQTLTPEEPEMGPAHWTDIGSGNGSELYFCSAECADNHEMEM